MKRYPQYKPSGIQWIGDIPEHWHLDPFGRFFNYSKGLSITKEDLIPEGISVISYGQIHSKSNEGTRITPELIRFVSPRYLDTAPQALVQENDFIFADTSEDLEGCGNCVFIDREDTIFAGYHTLVCRPHDFSNHRYLAYYFLSPAWRCALRSQCNGVKVFSISRGKLKKTKITVPSDAEQRDIVAFLDRKTEKIAEYIAAKEAEIEKLGTLKQSVISRAVTRGLNPNAPMKDSQIPWIGDVPEHWGKRRIKNLFTLRDERNYEDLSKVNLISVYAKLGVVQHCDIEATTGNRAVKADGYKIVHKDDIVVNIILCWMGALGKSEYDGVTSPAYDVYQPKNGVNCDYYHYLFRTNMFCGECMRQGRGIMMMRWRTYSKEFTAIHVPFPPPDEQQAIVDFIDRKVREIDEYIGKIREQIEKLKLYKQRLISDAVTGKIDVRNAAG